MKRGRMSSNIEDRRNKGGSVQSSTGDAPYMTDHSDGGTYSTSTKDSYGSPDRRKQGATLGVRGGPVTWKDGKTR